MRITAKLVVPLRVRWLRPLVAATAAAGLWWGAAKVLELPPFLLPAPRDVAAAFATHYAYLAEHTFVTIGHTLGGYTIAAAAAISVAVLLAASTPARDALLPLLVALQAVPKVAIAPLLIIWLGFGPSSKIALVALLCFFPIVVATLAGLQATPTHLVELARSLCASRLATFTKIRLLYAGPQMFAGLKVAISLSLIGAVVAQMTSPTSGLGAVIILSAQAVNTPLAFAAITLLAGIGISLYYSLTGLERWLLPWARHTTA